MVLDPEKLCFKHKIMKNTVYDKKRFSTGTLDKKAFFSRNGWFLRKTQISTPNGLRPSKKLLSTQNNEKHSLGHKTPIST